jgi:hypothetical protein
MSSTRACNASTVWLSLKCSVLKLVERARAEVEHDDRVQTAHGSTVREVTLSTSTIATLEAVADPDNKVTSLLPCTTSTKDSTTANEHQAHVTECVLYMVYVTEPVENAQPWLAVVYATTQTLLLRLNNHSACLNQSIYIMHTLACSARLALTIASLSMSALASSVLPAACSLR